MDESLLTIGQLALRLNLPRWRLQYLIERGAVPGPSVQVPGRRLFSLDDVRKIAEAMERRTEKEQKVRE